MSIQDDYFDIKAFLESRDVATEESFDRFSRFAFQQEADASILRQQIKMLKQAASVLRLWFTENS